MDNFEIIDDPQLFVLPEMRSMERTSVIFPQSHLHRQRARRPIVPIRLLTVNLPNL